MRTIMIMLLLLVASVALYATSSGLVSIPSTDIQPKGIWHLGVDSFVFPDGDASPASLVDFGITYGLHERVEVGFDVLSGSDTPLYLNAKVLVTPVGSPVALAAGVFNVGTSNPEDSSIVYAVASTILPESMKGVRLTAGPYLAQKANLGDDNSGFMLGLDKTVGKYWLAVDYISGSNLLGSVNLGLGYTVSDKSGFIVGYNMFNDSDAAGTNDAINFQYDLNL